MSRREIARSAASKLAAADLSSLRAVLGFDGFIDEISEIVDQRHGVAAYDKIPTIERFGAKIVAAAGHSCNFERVVKRRKLGGNGLIMAHALATLGASVTYIGTVGDAKDANAPDPLFHDLAQRATLIPVGPPALTHALEFSDGKLMIGNLASLNEVTWERIIQVVGRDRLRALCDEAMLLGMLNWTMLPHLTEIWKHASAELLPLLTGKRRTCFIDLADPAKRPVADLRAAMSILGQINHRVEVTLGLNLSEARQVAAACAVPAPSDHQDALPELARRLREFLGLACVVVHPRHGAAAAMSSGVGYFAGPFVKRPALSTGAGDHFNAGFTLGQSLQFTLEESLCLGTAVSGYYVRHAVTPNSREVIGFLEALPEPEC